LTTQRMTIRWPQHHRRSDGALRPSSLSMPVTGGQDLSPQWVSPVTPSSVKKSLSGRLMMATRTTAGSSDCAPRPSVWWRTWAARASTKKRRSICPRGCIQDTTKGRGNLPIDQPTHQPTYLSTYLPTYLSGYRSNGLELSERKSFRYYLIIKFIIFIGYQHLK
jgi:hypothetical protein